MNDKDLHAGPGAHTVHRERQVRMSAVMALLLVVTSLTILAGASLAQPLAQGKSKFLGNALTILRSDFGRYWNQVTPGNAGKWGSVEGVRNSYNWAPLDDIYNYAIFNSFRCKHHCLVWGEQQPGWIASLDTASQRAEVEEWIRSVGERYPSMSFVDVVNEPFHAIPSYASALGGSGTTGWDWVVTAFRLARQHCIKGVKLVLNEYNVVHDNTVTTTYLRLIDTLRARNLIDAIGVQGHYFEFRSPAGTTPAYTYPLSAIRANLARLTATGLPVYITEFDINEPDDSTQLANYQTYFPIFWDDPGVAGITLWGYAQADVWKVNAYLVRSDGSERPALKWLRRYVACPFPPLLAAPVGTSGEPRNPRLCWHPAAGASSYHLQLASSGTFSTVLVDSMTADTLVQLAPLAANGTFYWHVSAINDSGAGGYSPAAMFRTGTDIVAVRESNNVPLLFELFQNYPNPFNPTTTFRFSLPRRCTVHLRLLNVLGQQVAEIARGEFEAGMHQVRLDAGGLASGVYYSRMDADEFHRTGKLVLVK